MNRYIKSALVLLLVFSACARTNTAVDKVLVEQVLQDFSTERIAYYLRESHPKSNREFLDAVLSRRGASMQNFIPALRRYFPHEAKQLLGE